VGHQSTRINGSPCVILVALEIPEWLFAGAGDPDAVVRPSPWP